MPFNTNNLFLSMAMLNHSKLAQDKKMAAAVGSAFMPGILGLAFPLIVARSAGATPSPGAQGAGASGAGAAPGAGQVHTQVPDVLRLTEAQAVEQISAAGLTPVVERSYFKQVGSAAVPPNGQVAAQEPKASAEWVEAGTEVVLQVSLGAQASAPGNSEHAEQLAMEAEIKNRISAVDTKMDTLLSKVALLNGGTDGAPH